MKKISTLLSFLVLLIVTICTGDAKSQNAGIGTQTPDHKLHIAGNIPTLLKLDNTTNLNTGIMSEMYFKTGTHYTGALKTIGNSAFTSRLGFFTYAVTNPTALLERMSIMDNGYVGIGTNNPGFLLDVNGRMRVRNGGGTAGIAFMDANNIANKGFVGMKDDSEVGFYGYTGAGWGLTMNVSSGDVSIVSSQLYVTTDDTYAAYFNNSNDGGAAVEARCENVAGYGAGIEAYGGEYGVNATADVTGTGHRYG
ncbi:MAG: hypothetical protein H7X99_02545, partial [Saprospiraceae bacterium]|nr:hypothetical protein [Saprospiraceae bacterium]